MNWRLSKNALRALGLLGLVFVTGFGCSPAAAILCSVSMSNVVFGNIDVTAGAAVDTTGTMTVTCSGGAPPNRTNLVCISIGAGQNGDATSRILSGPASLRYELYSNASRTVKWGSWQTGYDSAGVSAVVPYNGSANLTVYGRVLGSQQTLLSGSYSDTLSGQPFITYTYNFGSKTCPDAGPDGTNSASFTASATVITSCGVSASNINFGTLGFISSNFDSNGAVTALCTNGSPYNVGLSAGNGSGATVAARKMTNGANTVTYSLYTTISRTTVWGNTIGTNTLSGTGTGTNQTLTVYGRVPPQTTPPVGTYSDTVVVTVTF